MFQCLSEEELRDLLAGALGGDRGAGAAAHLRGCASCADLQERIQGSTLVSPHHDATQIEAIASNDSPAPAHAGSALQVDRGKTQPAAPPPPRGSVSIDEFLQNLSQSGLLPPAEVQSVREQSAAEPSRGTSVAELVSWLIGKNKLTRYQAELLCRGQRGGFVLGNYIVLDKIGQGGMGTVFKARHRRMNRLVALKVLPAAMSSIPEAITRFQREVEAAARLSHPNIAAAYDADEAEGLHFLVMEYVEGPNLASYVKEKGPLPIGAAVRLLAQAARGLATAHAVGIVHRDIKPSNLMVNRQGKLKILDMGLAQMRDSACDVDLTSDVTQTGRVMGTVDYMAPEQARDAKSVDYRADIYSLGCTAYFLLAGRTPAPAGSAAEKLLFHQALTAAPLASVCPAVSPRLAAIVAQMMAKQADDRPQSLTEIADEFDRCLAEQPADAELALDGTELQPAEPSTLHGSRPAGERWSTCTTRSPPSRRRCRA